MGESAELGVLEAVLRAAGRSGSGRDRADGERAAEERVCRGDGRYSAEWRGGRCGSESIWVLAEATQDSGRGERADREQERKEGDEERGIQRGSRQDDRGAKEDKGRGPDRDAGSDRGSCEGDKR